MQKGFKNGFTLLEIIAVISLLIVVSSMAIPAYTNVVDNQKKRADIVTALQLADIAKTYYIETKNTDTSGIKKYIEKQFDEEPKSKYSNSSFEVTLDSTSKKPTVKIAEKDSTSYTIVLVENGKPVDTNERK